MTSKIFLVFTFSLFLSAPLLAQNGQKTEQKVGKYIIKIITNPDNTYGYEVYDDVQLRIKHISKPYSQTSGGFLNKINALIMAKWEVLKLEQNKKNGDEPNLATAKDLGISKEDLNNQ